MTSISIAKVLDNSDLLRSGRILVSIGSVDNMWINYTTPVDGITGGFFAIPEVGAVILICKPENISEWYYMSSIVSPSIGDILGKGFQKVDTFLPVDLYNDSGQPQKYGLKTPKGNQIILSDEYGPDYSNIAAKIESSTGKKITLNDSLDAIIIENEFGDRIKISSNANGSSGRRSIDIECTGQINLISRESSVDLRVIDGKEINIVNESTGSKRANANDPTPGNINISSKNADINLSVQSKTGVVRLEAEGEDGHIVLSSQGSISLEAQKGININAGLDVNIVGENIYLNYYYMKYDYPSDCITAKQKRSYRNKFRYRNDIEFKKRSYEATRRWTKNNQEHSKEWYREWWINNKDKLKETRKMYREINKEKERERAKQPSVSLKYRVKRYGLTVEDYTSLLEAQDNSCFICKTKEPKGVNNSWHIDHNHQTGKVRGILCHHCNTMLGLARDNIDILSRAIEYLKKDNTNVL